MGYAACFSKFVLYVNTLNYKIKGIIYATRNSHTQSWPSYFLVTQIFWSIQAHCFWSHAPFPVCNQECELHFHSLSIFILFSVLWHLLSDSELKCLRMRKIKDKKPDREKFLNNWKCKFLQRSEPYISVHFLTDDSFVLLIFIFTVYIFCCCVFHLWIF